MGTSSSERKSARSFNANVFANLSRLGQVSVETGASLPSLWGDPLWVGNGHPCHPRKRTRPMFVRGETSNRTKVRRPIPDLEAGIDRLALQRQDGKHAFVDPSQRLPGDEPFQSLMSQRKLAEGEVSLAA